MIKKIIMIICLLSNHIYCMDNQQICIYRNPGIWPFLIRSLANHHEIPQAKMIIKFKASNIKEVTSYRKLNIDVLHLINRRDIKDDTKIEYISQLIIQGADPNYTYATKKTPLIRSVESNSLKLVECFVNYRPNSVGLNCQNLNTRKYNLIYDQAKLKRIFVPIIDYMLKLETHNATNPEDQQNCEKRIFADVHTKELIDAFSIDKLLEDREFPAPFEDYFQNPLLQLLQKKPYQKAFNYIFASRNIADYMPQSIISILSLIR